MIKIDTSFVGPLVVGRTSLLQCRGSSNCSQRLQWQCRMKRIRMAIAEATESNDSSNSKELSVHQADDRGGGGEGAVKGEFRKKFEKQRGKDVPTVSEAMETFLKEFSRPIPIVYRSIINETLITTHLSRVCPMWKYDQVFAFGFLQIFDDFLKFYPQPDEKEKLLHALATALRFDPVKIKKDGQSVKNWISGKTENDIFHIMEEDADDSSPLYSTFMYLRNAGPFDWYYSRLFGIGLIKIMEAVDVKLTNDNAEKWAEKLNISKAKFASELAAYLSVAERLKQAEQIFAEASAREARKVAERLAAKAAKAKEEADKAETESSGAPVGATEEATVASSSPDPET